MGAVWVVEIAVVLLAAHEFVQVANRPAFRNETVWKPGWKWPLLGSSAILSSLTLWAALRWPVFRHIGVAGLVVVMVAAWWRARPWYGRLRRLPPGSLGLGSSLDAIHNQRHYLEQAARFGPVFKMSQFAQPVVCMVGLSRARAVLAEHGASLAGAKFWKRYNRYIPKGALRYMNPGTHREIAPTFRATYGSLDLERAEPVLRAIYRSKLARAAADSSREPDGLNLHSYLQRAMLEAVGYLFYGLRPGDVLLDELERCMPLLLTAAYASSGWEGKTRAGMEGVAGVLEQIRHRPSPAQEGGFTPALAALVATHPEALDDRTIMGNFILISRVAHGDLTGLHMWIFKLLCDHPEVLDPIRNRSAGERAGPGGSLDLGTRIVMETLRLEQSEYLYRRVTRTFEHEGMVVPAGWDVRFCTHESHRDPAVFPDPDRFDPDRFVRRRYSRDEYAPFGSDAHGCMGSHIAHFLGALFVDELAMRYHWRVLADGPAESGGNRHRSHWHPSERQRVVLTARTGALTAS